MIEIVYQEKQEDVAEEEGYFHIPKNIRQIGDSPNNRKIYIEDYVYTHLNRMVEESLGVGRMAILLGECRWLNGIAYYFIRSSFQVDGKEISAQNIPFDDETWGAIYSTVKEHFSGQEIIGWFLSVPDFEMEINNLVYRTHLEHFGENDKVLFAMDSVEKEEQLYIYDGTQMEEQKGYYIYYEKNDPMQEYLIARKENGEQDKSEEVEDKAVRDFRKIISSKTDNKSPRNLNPLISAASICLAGIVLVGGITFMKNYEKMQSMQELISNIQGNETEQVSSIHNDVVDTTNGNKQTDEGKGGEQIATEGEQSNQAEKDEVGAIAGNTGEGDEADSAVATPKEEESTPTTGGVGKKYMVKKGDTLSGISKSYYGTIWKVVDICEANKLTSEDVIYPGQIIVLP